MSNRTSIDKDELARLRARDSFLSDITKQLQSFSAGDTDVLNLVASRNTARELDMTIVLSAKGDQINFYDHTQQIKREIKL